MPFPKNILVLFSHWTLRLRPDSHAERVLFYRTSRSPAVRDAVKRHTVRASLSVTLASKHNIYYWKRLQQGIHKSNRQSPEINDPGTLDLSYCIKPSSIIPSPPPRWFQGTCQTGWSLQCCIRSPSIALFRRVKVQCCRKCEALDGHFLPR